MYDPSYPVEEFHHTDRDNSFQLDSFWTSEELSRASAEVADEQLANTPDPLQEAW